MCSLHIANLARITAFRPGPDQAIRRAGRQHAYSSSRRVPAGYSSIGLVATSPPPLHRLKVILSPSAETVNHHPVGAGEFSTGEMRNFQPALTYRGSSARCPLIDKGRAEEIWTAQTKILFLHASQNTS
jgi:hypothetical protein